MTTTTTVLRCAQCHHDRTTGDVCPMCGESEFVVIRNANPTTTPVVRKAKMYSLFIRARGSRRWERISPRYMPIDRARQFYQDALLGFAFQAVEARLRPVKGPAVVNAAVSLARCMAVRATYIDNATGAVKEL